MKLIQTRFLFRILVFMGAERRLISRRNVQNMVERADFGILDVMLRG